ncbi:MAG: hypothetical protein V1800_12495 [Candidatus Latescibacterota bacterium]
MAKYHTPSGWPFTRRNWVLFFIGLGVIVLGYMVLRIPPAQGFLSLTLAPILLVIGYCVLVPIAILIGEKKRKSGG